MLAKQASSPAVVMTALALVAACAGSRDDQNRAGDSATHATASSGAIAPSNDSTTRLSAVTAAVGPGIQITSTDQHEVSRSLDLKLTDDNWSKFMRAADSVAALRARDASVRQHLDQQIVAAREDDAGRKWLEAEPKVVAAITAAGLSVKDYFRLGIATAAAARFMDDPQAAPPTPAGRENADFLRSHASDLEHLRALSAGGPGAVRAQ